MSHTSALPADKSCLYSPCFCTWSLDRNDVCFHVWKCFLSSTAWRQTLTEEATMNKQGYYHNHPQHRRRTKTVNHPRNLLRLIWFAFEIDFDFNFDHEQMGLPPPLTVSLFLRFSGSRWLSFSVSHTHTVHSRNRRRLFTHTNKAESPQTLWHFQRGLTLISFFFQLCFQKIKVCTNSTNLLKWVAYISDNKQQACLNIEFKDPYWCCLIE